MTNPTLCPYCQNKLDKPPTRKTKCPHCSQFIYVRGGKPMTEEEVEVTDAVASWCPVFSEEGAPIGDTERQSFRLQFDKVRAELTQQFGVKAPINDTIWRMLNASVVSETNPDRQAGYYLAMARLVRTEGKDPHVYIQQANECRGRALVTYLLSLQRQGVVDRVRVMTCNDEVVCSGCEGVSSASFSIREALQKMPIPHSCTSAEGCRCIYSPEVEVPAWTPARR